MALQVSGGVATGAGLTLALGGGAATWYGAHSIAAAARAAQPASLKLALPAIDEARQTVHVFSSFAGEVQQAMVAAADHPLVGVAEAGLKRVPFVGGRLADNAVHTAELGAAMQRFSELDPAPLVGKASDLGTRLDGVMAAVADDIPKAQQGVSAFRHALPWVIGGVAAVAVGAYLLAQANLTVSD